MKKILGIDYGTKRIGLAVNIGSFAEPLTILPNKISQEDPIVSGETLDKLLEILESRQIEQIVLGISEQEMAEKIKEFAAIIKTKTEIPLDLMDETLSSREVSRKMKEAKFSLKKRKGAIDHYAAALILEEWLDMCYT
jgi:putative transcription antitermination factor YqgF